MITAILLTLLGTALVAVLLAMVRSPSGTTMSVPAAPGVPKPVARPTDPLELDAWDAKPGDIVSIEAAAADFSDLDFPVQGRGAYEANNHRWLELSGDYRGRAVRLEVYRYPQPQILGVVDDRTIGLADLGVTEDQLGDFDARQDPTASVFYDSKTWRYESSREIGYCENENGTPEGLYRWVFVEQNGSRRLFVEKRQGEPFGVRLARLIDSRDISIYRA